MRSDYERLSEILGLARQIALDFHADLRDRPVASPVTSMAPRMLSEDGVGAAGALRNFSELVAPHLSASVGPRYLGFVTGGATPAALVGDWLAAAVDQNPPSPGDSIAPALTDRTIAMMADLFELPFGEGGFDGVFTSGALGANVLGAVCFREWAGRRSNVDVTAHGVGALTDIEIFTASPHVTMLKALGLVGLGRQSYVRIAPLEGREAMDVSELERALERSMATNRVVIASAGIVSTGDSEAIDAIADLCDRYDAWLHVDGAFGLYARCSPRFASMAAGVERARSITTDCHKWLNVPYDCGLFLTRELELLEEAMRLSAPYLQTDDPAPAYLNRGIESSQRFRALPVWMTLEAYGRRGVREMTERCCDLALELGRRLERMEGYELLAPVSLNIVLFRGWFGSDERSNAKQRVLMQTINATGKVFLTPGLLGDRQGMRAAFSNWMTGAGDIDIIADALARARSECSSA
ncbi:MAG: pyridoxal phosphate-dependent decarboxylase family protein [Gammaproteobacteria bacterium]